ncbi:MAG: hypothetical protein AB8F95_19705 [Bacteroidia bacterium]
MGFFKKIGDFFKRLFGGKTNKPTAPPVVITPTKPRPTPPPPPTPDLEAIKRTKGKALLEIERIRTVGDVIHGRVSLEGQSIAQCLEFVSDSAPVGEHRLQLRESGGLHATYSFRYPDMHDGLLQIGDKFAYLRTGTEASDARGGIVLAESIQEQGGTTKALGSDQAYRKVYPRLKAMLKDGEAVSILIS